jgi:glycosyltransferase involved in cell wall biosynthesis
VRPDISVLIPARNEEGRVAETIRALSRARQTDARLEYVVVDDASTDGGVASLVAAVPELLDEPNIDIKLSCLEEHSGTYRARNWAARNAVADVLFITDAHVTISPGWDRLVLEQIGPDRLLAGVIVDQAGSARAYGCSLVIPFMGTRWNLDPVDGVEPVQVAPCIATAITRDLFERLGGYDPGMLIYGAGEPEFSVRAWLYGAEIDVVPDLQVGHRFKPQDELSDFLAEVRPYWVHNCIRFGLLYLSELGCMQLLRFYALSFPNVYPSALRMVDDSDVWRRRAFLEGRRRRPFEWFVSYFGLRDQIGGELV